jgi:hypothetical protein
MYISAPTRETDKKAEQFCKKSYWNDEIDQNNKFAKFKVPSGFFCTTINCIIQELKFVKTVQLFCVPNFLVRGRTERIERKL